jgi:transposase
MALQYVKPCLQTNKSDFLDAEAIAEAVQRQRMRFVPIKTEEQLDLQAWQWVHERWVMRHTTVVNQVRSQKQTSQGLALVAPPIFLIMQCAQATSDGRAIY